VKYVPDTETVIKITPDAKGIEQAGIKMILNPYDEFAVEAALQLKEKTGDGEVTVVTVGPDAATAALRSALAMGADKAILVKGETGFCTGLTVARALAEVLRMVSFDVLLFGSRAVDDDNLQVGPMVATLLNLPCATTVTKLEVQDGRAVAERPIEGGTEVIETPLPAAFSCHKGMNEPRYASLKGIMASKKKPVEERTPSATEPEVEVLSLSFPPDRPPGKIVGEGVAAVPELVRLLREEAKVI
jgi:electron transfer flavoprotein beta subunit